MPKKWKGILLAGGAGTRLYPLTRSVSKQLMPIYNKPLVYYPLSVLMMAGIRDIAVISTPEHLPLFSTLLGDGGTLGCSFTYIPQARPEGIAQAFLLADKFIGNASVSLVLGDNIFFGHGLPELLLGAKKQKKGATVFACHVTDPERYGVVTFDRNNRVVNIEEKPSRPQSNFAVSGLYFYDNDVVDIARSLSPSKRGELEITDVNNQYLRRGDLYVQTLGRGIAWIDTGTHEALLAAGNFVQVMEQRQGLKVGCIEEIAWRQGFITTETLHKLGKEYEKSGYGQYLLSLE
ncbi:glucose-1-phosphate thymidylyltransferase [Deltaproteobacteria bacterium]|nr:glucose-1-phosphate thymidylyltransferase [Deltaproteobacteria bacterium]